MFDKKILKQKIDENDLISFDMFDTLVLRPYLKPSDVFLHIEEIINKEQSGKVFSKIKKWAHRRGKSERLAREYKYKKQGSKEVNIDEIYEFFGKKYGEKYKKYKQLEIDLELQTIQPNKEIQEVYNYAISKNKTIVITSDMYLNSDISKTILNKCGYYGFKKIYVSNEIQTNKESGGAYKYICKDLNIDCKKCIHIGDNQNADFKQAIKQKWNAFYYQKPLEQFFEDKENKKFLNIKEKNKENLDTSIILGMMILRWNNNKNNQKNDDYYWQNFGYNLGGAYGYSYVNFILEQSRKDNIEYLCFLARDGFTLQKIYNELKNKNDAKGSYVFCNRLLQLKCLPFLIKKSKEHDRLNAIIYIFSQQSKKIDNFFRKFYTKIKDLNNLSLKYKIKYLLKFRDDILKLANQNLDRYKEYIKNLNINSNKIALVDILSLHWSAQNLLKKVLGDDIIGYYVYAYKAKRYRKKSKYKSWCKHFNDKEKLLCYPIIEILFSAPHPYVIDIKNNIPVYYNEKNTYLDCYNFVSNGILEFTKDMLDFFGKYKINFSHSNCVKNIDCFVSDLSIKDEDKMKSILFSPSVIVDDIKVNFYQEIKRQLKTKTIKGLFITKSYCNDPHKDRIFYKLFNHFNLLKITITKKNKKYYLFRFIPICIRSKK